MTGSVGEDDVEDGELSHDLRGEPGVPHQLGEAVAQGVPGVAQPRVGAGLPQLGEGGEPGHRGDGIAVQGADLGDVVGGALQARIEGAHDLLAPAHGGQRKAAAHDLAHRGEVGDDAVVLLGAAVGEAKARHHLVEDQRNLVAPRQLAQALQESGAGGISRWKGSTMTAARVSAWTASRASTVARSL